MELNFFTWIREVMAEVASCTLMVGIDQHALHKAALHEQAN